MEKKNIDWSSLGFGYVKTDKRFVANYKDGAWDAGCLTDDVDALRAERLIALCTDGDDEALAGEARHWADMLRD